MNETRQDNFACGAVLATMIFTMLCGAFVVDASTPSPANETPAHSETGHE